VSFVLLVVYDSTMISLFSTVTHWNLQW